MKKKQKVINFDIRYGHDAQYVYILFAEKIDNLRLTPEQVSEMRVMLQNMLDSLEGKA